MVCELINLIYYLNASYAVLYPKCMGSGIQAIEKINKLLSAMTACRNAFHNGPMTHTCYKFMKVLYTTFIVTCVVLMEAIFPCFNLNPNDWNLATTILVHKLSQLHKTLILGRLWLEFH